MGHALHALGKLPVARVTPGVLQRRCACGTHTPAGVECTPCAEKRRTATRSAAGHASAMVAPPIVHDVLRMPGEPLDHDTRAFMEPRFGWDFSSVRVHSGSLAKEAARAVNADAFAVGQSIVFSDGRYAPSTQAGQQLLAHELAHTTQQAGADGVAGDIEIGHEDALAEREADTLSRLALAGDIDGARRHNVATGPRLSRQSSSDPKPWIPLPHPLDRLDIAPQFPNSPITPPKLSDAEKAAALLRGEKGSVPGAANCSGFIGYSPGTGAYKGQCCDQQKTQSADTCCTTDRFSVKDNRCCHTDEVLHGTACVKIRDLGVQPRPPDFKLPPADKPPLQDAPAPNLPKGEAYV